MQSLFRFESQSQVGSVQLQQWSYAKAGLLDNLDKIQQYYHTYPIAVKASHVLVRLIQSIAVSRKLDFERYVANCVNSGLQAAKAIGFTTSLNKGAVWNGEFYGSRYKEVLIAHNELFNLQDLATQWKTTSAVTVLQSEETDLSMLPPDGRINSTSEGLAVISVNVPLLMAQYYWFNKEQDIVEANGGARRTIYQFVHAYALTNMLPSHLDCVCFNRLYNRLIGTPNAEPVRKHSFFLVDYSNALNAISDQQLKYVKGLDKRFDGVMRTVALPYSDNLSNFAHLPNTPVTTQVFWALAISRLKILSFLYLIRDNPEVVSGGELKTIRWLMRIHQTRNTIHANLGYETFYKISKYLDIPRIE